MLANKWTTFANNWRYQKGDNKAWANPEFNDTSWKEFSAYNLNMPDGEHAIADRGEIVWFRKRIKADSSLNDFSVLRIYQLGASEIYLDGKLIHQLGKVSSDIDKVIYNNPFNQILQLPLEKGKEQVLAVRYVNAQYKFPSYSKTKGYIGISASSLSNANSTDIIKNYLIVRNLQFIDNYNIALGIAILMFIIFLSFFLFFPNEKINGYFATSIFFTILFDIGVIWAQSYPGIQFWITFSYDTSIVISFLILLYCLYKILEQPLDIVFKTISFLSLITIGGYFLYEPDILAPIWAILSFIATLRIAVKSWKENRVGSLLFLISSFISLLYWAIYVMSIIGLIPVNLNKFIPFAFMVMPVTLAIYLGYSFGKRSQELRLNLDRVQNLSKEKEAILNAQNETLEIQVKERTASLNQSLDNLKSTQSQLIQSEKMASLGELTAGIAHEIQNPLNFVNNFSEVNAELIDELAEEVDKGNLDEVKALAKDIKENEQKINHHGKRADAIVKGMLQHSRSSNGVKEPTDINVLADEYLRLSYHGLRAKDKSFNANFKTEFDPELPKINVIPQDISRVLLNLINNAFYAVAEKAQQNENNYKPEVVVSTKKLENKIEIRVKDNGDGIPDSVKDKIFQPFFTTKPTGQGTGLGLSLSYDIITKAHGGEMKVETKVGEGSQFIIQIPIS
jgi:signal transduction histidine kinase